MTAFIFLVCLLAMLAASMDDSELVNKMAEGANLSEGEARLALGALYNGIGDALVGDDWVTLPGFGTFKVMVKSGTRSYHKKSTESKVPKFSPASALKNDVLTSRRRLSVVDRLIALLMEEEEVGMSQTTLVKRMATAAHISSEKAGSALDAFIGAVTDSLRKGEPVVIRLGTFSIETTKDKTGRDGNGRMIRIWGKKSIRFTPSTEFTRQLN